MGDKIISKTGIKLCVEEDEYCYLPEVEEEEPGHITHEKDAQVMGMVSGGKFVKWEIIETDANKMPHQRWSRSLFDKDKYFTLTLGEPNGLLHGFHGTGKLTIGQPKMPSTHEKIFGNNQHFFPIFLPKLLACSRLRNSERTIGCFRIFFTSYVTIMCRNDELSWSMS